MTNKMRKWAIAATGRLRERGEVNDERDIRRYIDLLEAQQEKLIVEQGLLLRALRLVYIEAENDDDIYLKDVAGEAIDKVVKQPTRED